MAQYTYISKNQYQILRDESTGLNMRVGIRNSRVVYDAELIANGFTVDVEDASWKNIGGYGDEITGNKMRMGVRDGNWVVDIELTATGFTGTEDLDWINIGGIDVI